MVKKVSIKRGVLFFSVMLFLAIFVVGSVAFFLSMQDIIHSSKRSELLQFIENKRLELESSVKGEIAIALKMADSPLIQRYFANPTDSSLEKIAFEEIEGYRRAFTKSTVFWVNDIDKKFYSDAAYAFTVDPYDSKNYWYGMTLKETNKYNFNINYNPDLKNTNLWINVPVFDNKRKAIGILGAGIDLTTFIQSVYKNYSKSVALYFFNEAEEITGASDVEVVASKVHISKLLGSTGEKIFNVAKSLSQNSIENFTVSEGEVVVSTVPVLGWYVAAVYPISNQDYLRTYMTAIYLAAVLVIAFIFIIFNLFLGTIIKPLKNMAKTLKSVSTTWDLTQRIADTPKNEIGDISYSFNRLMEALKIPIIEAKIVTDSFASTSMNLSSISSQLTEYSQNMLSKSATMIKTNERMNESISSMAQNTEEASVNANQVADVAEMMSDNMNTISATINETSANINQISNSAEKTREIASKAAEKSGVVNEVISKLDLAAKEIGEVTDVIKRIADKTNLLALNATIEAASAGAAGKGFAVVASEIKELANQSAKNADDISLRIESIQSSVSNAVVVINDVSNIILEINRSVETIATNVDHQNKISNEVSGNIEQTDVCTKMVSNAIKEVAKNADDISKNAGDITSGTKSVTDSILNISEAAKASSECTLRVNDSVRELQKMSSDLKEAIVKFKV
ncbi:MAG: methyl-accepting chemotaxis protein [Fibromonadaceae bacterium]|jgi:methyl-accepting chemotaxis protein|nr:methyl-accepting chemotaxis protein [Fibromonadaceae bacterium]